MAKLAVHGPELGRIEYRTYTKAYFENGDVLKNAGSGWKLAGKVKAGIDPKAHFEKVKGNHDAFLAARPAFAAYVKELRALTGLNNRWKLDAAVALLPDDPDGVWSEACDGYGDNVHADIDDVSKLCDLYKAAEREAAELRKEKANV